MSRPEEPADQPLISLCRDCLRLAPIPGPLAKGTRCPACRSPRLVAHGELTRLSLAHIDCDAFFASVEKRDRPELAAKPVIVGGRHRGVVAACCYVARIYGVRSAMPMFKALQLCPDAVVLPVRMEAYRAAGLEIRAMMQEITPLVEPVSIDEAYLDLTGTEELHHASPVETLARLALRIEKRVGVTVSIGLSYNKFLAKIASDLDKPRGFAAIGRAEARGFLAERPVGLISGVGRQLQKALRADGVERIGELLRFDERTLLLRYGKMGRRLYRFARGKDDRAVQPDAPTKSVSGETTLDQDLSDIEALSAHLWRQSERVAERLRRKGLAGQRITLKLKTNRFQILTRSRTLADPTQMAERIYRAGLEMLRAEVDGQQRYRLIGIGAAELVDAAQADPPDLLDPMRGRRQKVEQAMESVRAKLGREAISLGRGFQTAARKQKPKAQTED